MNSYNIYKTIGQGTGTFEPRCTYNFFVTKINELIVVLQSRKTGKTVTENELTAVKMCAHVCVCEGFR